MDGTDLPFHLLFLSLLMTRFVDMGMPSESTFCTIDPFCWWINSKWLTFRINILFNFHKCWRGGAQPDHTFPVFSNPSTYIVKCQQWLVFRINFLCICTNTRGWGGGGGVSLTVQCTFPLAHKDLIQSIQSNPIPSTYISYISFAGHFTQKLPQNTTVIQSTNENFL